MELETIRIELANSLILQVTGLNDDDLRLEEPVSLKLIDLVY
jgi:hypothetical protein